MPNLSKSPELIVQGSALELLAFSLDCASIGVRVRHELSGLRPTFSNYYADPDCQLADFIEFVARPLDALAEAQFYSETEVADAVYVWHAGSWLKTPGGQLLGIPGFPISEEMHLGLGSLGMFRAYLDRLKPVLTIGKTRYLGDLIDARLGKKLREIFVEPQVQYLFGVSSENIAVQAALPGINEELTRRGSLTGAVMADSDHLQKRFAMVRPSIGFDAFYDAVILKLRELGVEVVEEELRVAGFSDTESHDTEPNDEQPDTVALSEAEQQAKAIPIIRQQELGGNSPRFMQELEIDIAEVIKFAPVENIDAYALYADTGGGFNCPIKISVRNGAATLTARVSSNEAEFFVNEHAADVLSRFAVEPLRDAQWRQRSAAFFAAETASSNTVTDSQNVVSTNTTGSAELIYLQVSPDLQQGIANVRAAATATRRQIKGIV